MKRTILHFIYDLGRGGAETMLVRTLRELNEYNNIVVTIKDNDHFGSELVCNQHICMNLKTIASFPLGITTLKRLIKKHKVDIVHSHLFWPTMIARLATPKSIPLITTIHAFIGSSLEYKKWYIRGIDKFTYKLRQSVIIGVAAGALKEYFSFLNLSPHKSYILYTFVDMNRFVTQKVAMDDNAIFKVISIGALRHQKNYTYLVNAFEKLKNKNIELHIYGTGELKDSLEQLIAQKDAPVVLKGQVSNLEEVLPQYDAFVMSSTYEGFSLAVLEAMAVKLPLLLSNIQSFREQCEDTALYFDLEHYHVFIKEIERLRQDKELAESLSEQAYKRVTNHFTLHQHMEKLKRIYQEALPG